MYKKAWCICRVVVLLTKLIAFWRCRRRHFFVRSLLSKEGWRVLLLWCFFQFLRDLDDEITAIKLEEESLKRKMNGKKELQSCTKVRGTVLQYLYFSVISRFLLKTVHPFRHFLAVLPPRTLSKVETWKKILGTRVQHFLWGEGRGGTCVHWKTPRNASVLRLLSMIVVSWSINSHYVTCMGRKYLAGTNVGPIFIVAFQVTW